MQGKNEQNPSGDHSAARARVARWRERNPELNRLRQRFYDRRYRAKRATIRLKAWLLGE